MKRFDSGIIFGVLLLLGGGLLLLQTMGLLENASEVFWGGIFIAAGAFFLSLLLAGQWWGLFPGMILLAIGALIVLPEKIQDVFGRAIFLGGIGLSFWLVYLMDRLERWWALIPAGVLTTLAVVTLLPNRVGMFETGGVFFLGLAGTFLLVALLAGMRWAYYPAAALAVLGFLATVSLLDFANYIWAVLLIAAGGYLLFRYFAKR